MKQLYLLLIAVIIGSGNQAQTFNAISSPFPGMGRGAMAFVDFDNDDDLDLIMSGQDDLFLPMGKIFQNTNGTFFEVTTNFRGLFNSAMSVADYDHDGLQDVIITGQNVYQNKTYLYRNVGDLQFELADSTLLPAGANGDVAFGDYNNDGYADILLSGNNQTKLYYNDNNGSFADTEVTLPGMGYCSVAWGDYDNDGDKDILMSGDDGSTMTHIINNNYGSFNVVHSMDGAISGDACWGDHDMDGYLDFMFSGKDYNLVAVTYIYHNNTDNTFSNANAGFVGTALGPSDWIDFDNDTDPDVLLAGQNTTCGNSFTGLYTNNGLGIYSPLDDLAFFDRSASAWGDYDNDGDWDVLLAGINVSATKGFYRNDLISGAGFHQNTPPTPPVLTDIFTWEDFAVLSWSPATDLQSPQEAITYNIRIGSTSGASDILSADADVETGMRYVAETGNMGSRTFCIIQNLNPGTYYYSVQSIDQAYKSSEFSEESSFTILPTEVQDIDKGTPFSIRKDGKNLIVQSSLHDKFNISIYSTTGSSVFNSANNTDLAKVTIDGLANGIYVISISSLNNSYCFKINI